MTPESLAAAAAADADAARSLWRPPEMLMRPDHLGVLPSCRLSFLQALTNRMIRERWDIRLTRVDVDRDALGLAIYRVEANGHLFHSIIYSVDRYRGATGRTWETRWDVLVWIVEGEVTDEQIELGARVNPEIVTGGGRTGPHTLSWTRANWSDRSFDHILECLAAGRQPDVEWVSRVGYLLRNNYYQANGMNGTRMFAAYDRDHPLSGVYASQMLGIHLMRQSSLDLIEAAARARSPKAVPLTDELRRYIGVGNSTGIGLNLFVINHALLINRWLEQREQALALSTLDECHPRSPQVDLLLWWLDRAILNKREDLTDYGTLAPTAEQLADDLSCARDLVAEFRETGTIAGQPTDRPWLAMRRALEPKLRIEAYELVNSLLMEIYPSVVDPILDYGILSEEFDVAPRATVGALRELVRDEYQWALSMDVQSDEARHWIWYRSIEGEEPRLGGRSQGLGDRLDLAFDIPRELQRLDAALADHSHDALVGQVLLQNPGLRAIVARIQSLAGTSYHTVRDNMHHRDFSPVHLSRFVLTSLKGAEKIAGYSDRWVRCIFLQGAPTAAEISCGTDEKWMYPPRPKQT